MNEDDSKLVYSTDHAIPRKEKRPEQTSRGNEDPADQSVRVRLDRKGRGGKSVTLIEGLQMSQNHMGKLLKQLKGKLGTGGTIRDSSLEIQGEHCDVLISVLRTMGYRPKQSGAKAVKKRKRAEE